MEKRNEILPIVPRGIYGGLPTYLQRITACGESDDERDLLLLGSLTVLSACLPKVKGRYGGVGVYANLYLYVTAAASAGKGRMALCGRLVERIDSDLRRRYDKEMARYKDAKAAYLLDKELGKPVEPQKTMLVIPANSSSTAVFQILNDNDGVGLMFETEGDTLAKTFRSEFGNYSDGFRKAFHHEKISYMRRKDKEHVTLNEPKLSVLLSGTPQQVLSLIPDAENGLFSRFMFYYMNIQMEWKNVFADADRTLDSIFDEFGDEFHAFYERLKAHISDIHFALSETQQELFNAYFEDIQLEYYSHCGANYIATIRRLGLMAYRIAMVMSTLRLMEANELPERMVCEDCDFLAAMDVIDVLVVHAEYVYRMLPTPKQRVSETQEVRETNKDKLYKMLPEEFTRKDILRIGEELCISKNTSFRRLENFLNEGTIRKTSHGVYKKG